MAVVVVIVGRPGSGKTVAARYIAEMAEQRRFATCPLNDYDILYSMFEEDRQKAREQVGYKRAFEEAEHGGFDVRVFSVLDVALERLEEEEAKARKESPDLEHGIIMLEFARDNYCEALKHFSPSFLEKCYFLFIQTEVATCIKRVHERIAHPDLRDNRFVSDEIITSYYGKDDIFAGCNLVEVYHIRKEMKFVSNEDSLDDFKAQVADFAEMIFRQEAPHLRRIDGPTEESPTVSPSVQEQEPVMAG